MCGSTEKGEKMVYEVSYNDYLDEVERLIKSRKLDSGLKIQQHCLYDTDEDALTERERFLMILSVVVFEVKLELLTPELEDELYLYMRDYNSGKFNGVLGDDEKEQVIKDLTDCYNKVFSK